MYHDLKLIKPGEIRVRFSPSPTGALHIGTARTALFNYLFAEKNKGIFILRIEDTDVERSDPKWEEDIMENLKWLGIEWSEGLIADTLRNKQQKYIGKYGPYRQSERIPIYTKYLKQLLDQKKAYYCFCSEEELEAKRQYQMSIGQPPHYNGKCANLSEKEVKKYLAEKKPSIIRFRIPSKKVKFTDLIRDEVEFDAGLIRDIVIAKNLTTPLYNFAVVIDDFEMKISHVIRGEDHISNTPKQILIQEALDFPCPKYAHLPLILGPDHSKLSKRHGTISVTEYRQDGYLPEAIVNFMTLLGWNPGKDREFFSMSSLIKEFSLKDIQKGGAIFNQKKLDFLNGFYIRQKSAEKLTNLCLPYLIKAELIKPQFKSQQYPPAYGGMKIIQIYKIFETGEQISFDYLKKIIEAYKTRIKKLSEITELSSFFFKDKLDYPKELLSWQKMSVQEVKFSLDKSEKVLSKIKIENWEQENLEKILVAEAEKLSAQKGYKTLNRGYLLWPLRIALTGKQSSASPFEIAEILGKEKVLKRIKEAVLKL